MLVVFTLNSCEDKKHETPIIPIENTTEISINKDKKMQMHREETGKQKQKKESNTPLNEKNISGNFTLKDKQHTYKVTLLNQKLTFQNIKKPIVIINLFKIDCSSCLAQVKSFKKSEKKYKEDLFVLNLFDNNQDKEIINFIHAIQSNFDITTKTLPLTLIYKNGNYYSHFEGLAPIEMINHEIQQAIKK